MKLRELVSIAGLLFVNAANVHAAEYTVDPDGSGDFPSIQAAVDAAPWGSVILLLPGEFSGDGNHDVTIDRTITIQSVAGAESTHISCDDLPEAPHRAFKIKPQAVTHPVVTIEGVTITGGRAKGDESCDGREYVGGAICVTHYYGCPTVTIRDCVFRDNHADSGGAIFLCLNGDYDCAPIIEGCRFDENTATTDGGAICTNSPALAALDRIQLKGCLFRDNLSGRVGGAACIDARVTAMVEKCGFLSNRAHLRGGGLAVTGDESVLQRCTFYDNEAEQEGSAVEVVGTNQRIENCIVAANGPSLPVRCSSVVSCSDIWANEAGDWLGCLTGQEGLNGNFSRDPLFCDPALGDFRLAATSPCAPGNHPDGVDCASEIGSEGVGCSEPMLRGCCFGEICVVLPIATCQSNGGALTGSADCSPVPCAVLPRGACCIVGYCLSLKQYECDHLGGTFEAGVSCVPGPCANTGACCFGAVCLPVDALTCGANGGVFLGVGVMCPSNPCPLSGRPVPSALVVGGACCLGELCVVLTQSECEASGGAFQGDESTCDPNPCPLNPTGACCVDGLCLALEAAECTVIGGNYEGDGTACTSASCVGACCFQEICAVLAPLECEANGGHAHAGATTCDATPCAPTSDASSDEVRTPMIEAFVTPTPTGGEVRLVVALATPGFVRAELFSLSGRRVAIVASRWASAGVSELRWSPVDDRGQWLPNGVYWVRLRSGASEGRCRLVVAR